MTASKDTLVDYPIATVAIHEMSTRACEDTLPILDRHCDRLVAGDDGKDHFAKLVLPHLEEAYTLARQITGDRVDAEDVVQEACLRAFRLAATVTSATSDDARAWTLAVVRKVAAVWMRKNRSAAFVTPDEFDSIDQDQMRSWDSDCETPEAALIAKTDTAHLQAVIAELPAPFREILVLRDIQGLSYREIADMSGVPIGTVMSRLARGRSRVMKSIGADD